MSRFIMPAGCILDITEVMSLVLDYCIGEFGSPNSKGVSKGCAWGLFGGDIGVASSAVRAQCNYLGVWPYWRPILGKAQCSCAHIDLSCLHICYRTSYPPPPFLETLSSWI